MRRGAEPWVTHSRRLLVAAELPSFHDLWKGDNLRIKEDSVGLRIANLNFCRKLYASDLSMTQALDTMERLQLDILIGIEPGQASLFNSARLKPLARSRGMDVKLIRRNFTGCDGGVVMVTNKEWSKIPNEVIPYKCMKEHLNGRIMNIIFDNKDKNGDHSKIQIIAAHLLNSANNNVEDTARLLKWVSKQKLNFATKNPKAPSIMIGDFNAAESEYLDTDRIGASKESGNMEADSTVIQCIKDMKYHDLIRSRFPNTRMVTRAVTHQTNRLLDRIMVTKQMAMHAQSKVAIYKDSVTHAGSDHLMVVADFPIDTAYVTKKRENIWNMYTYSKWKWPERTEEEEGEAIASFNKELQESDNQDEVEWIREAAEKCLLVVEKTSFPKRPKTKERKHYTSDDWILSKSMVAIRHMRVQALSLADGDQLTQQVINQEEDTQNCGEGSGTDLNRPIRSGVEGGEERRAE